MTVFVMTGPPGMKVAPDRKVIEVRVLAVDNPRSSNVPPPLTVIRSPLITPPLMNSELVEITELPVA